MRRRKTHDVPGLDMTRWLATALFFFGISAACSGLPPLGSPTIAPRTNPTPFVEGPTLREIAVPALRAIEANPSTFGGGYVDAAGIAIHVLYVGEVDGARRLLESVLPEDAPVIWEHVDHSYTELDRIRSEVIHLWTSGPPDRITEVSVSVPTNTVLVGMPIPQPDLTAELQRRYGDAVSFAIVPPDEPA